MHVTVIAVGILGHYIPPSSGTEVLFAGATIEDLLGQLGIPAELVAMALVNGLQRPKGCLLAAGDIVKLIPLMGGG